MSPPVNSVGRDTRIGAWLTLRYLLVAAIPLIVMTIFAAATGRLTAAAWGTAMFGVAIYYLPHMMVLPAVVVASLWLVPRARALLFLVAATGLLLAALGYDVRNEVAFLTIYAASLFCVAADYAWRACAAP